MIKKRSERIKKEYNKRIQNEIDKTYKLMNQGYFLRTSKGAYGGNFGFLWKVEDGKEIEKKLVYGIEVRNILKKQNIINQKSFQTINCYSYYLESYKLSKDHKKNYEKYKKHPSILQPTIFDMIYDLK